MFWILVTSFFEIGWVLAWLYIAWNEFLFLFLRVWVWHLNYYNLLHQFIYFFNCIHLIFIFIPLSIYLIAYSLIYSFFNSMNWHLGFFCGYAISWMLIYSRFHQLSTYTWHASKESNMGWLCIETTRWWFSHTTIRNPCWWSPSHNSKYVRCVSRIYENMHSVKFFGEVSRRWFCVKNTWTWEHAHHT